MYIIVVPLPRRTLTICACIVMCPDLVSLSLLVTCCTQYKIYRHVGLALILKQNPKSKPLFAHTKLTSTNCCRILCSDWAKLYARHFILWFHFWYILCKCCWCTVTSYRDNHGYPAYWNRIQDHLWAFENNDDQDNQDKKNKKTTTITAKEEGGVVVGGGKDVGGLTLEGLYDEFLSGDRSRVKTRFM